MLFSFIVILHYLLEFIFELKGIIFKFLMMNLYISVLEVQFSRNRCKLLFIIVNFCARSADVYNILRTINSCKDIQNAG